MNKKTQLKTCYEFSKPCYLCFSCLFTVKSRSDNAQFREDRLKAWKEAPLQCVLHAH